MRPFTASKSNITWVGVDQHLTSTLPTLASDGHIEHFVKKTKEK
jgi:hypothetical protein